MKAKDIKKDDIFLVSPGRSVLTAKRGMAHAGGKITLADVDAKTMAAFIESGRVEIDKESFDAKVKAAAEEKARIAQAVEDGKKRKAEADALDAVPATEAEIIAAIELLEEGNTEHWTVGGSPQVAAIETLIGKQISAADRDAAWLAMQDNK